MLEGVAFNNRWLHDAVEHFARRRLDPLRMVGGGAQSDLWCQIHADVMDRTIERVASPLLANLRGAALLAGHGPRSAVRPREVRGLVGVDGVFRPDPARRAAYDRLYREFPRLYRAQRGMFARLNRGPGPDGVRPAHGVSRARAWLPWLPARVGAGPGIARRRGAGRKRGESMRRSTGG